MIYTHMLIRSFVKHLKFRDACRWLLKNNFENPAATVELSFWLELEGAAVTQSDDTIT